MLLILLQLVVQLVLRAVFLIGGNRKLLLMTGAEFTLILTHIFNPLFQKIFCKIFFQVPPNPPNLLHSLLSDIYFVIIFVVSPNFISVVLLDIFHNIFLVVFPDATSSFNFRDSFPIGNNLVYNSVNHIFVECIYYIIIYYFLNIIIPYLYNILYYIII